MLRINFCLLPLPGMRKSLLPLYFKIHPDICRGVYIAVFITGLLTFSSLNAQNNISGVVSDEFGKPLQGAEVRLDNEVTLTSIQGRYQIISFSRDRVRFSCNYPGLATFDTIIEIRGTAHINIRMKPVATLLKEVIVESESARVKELKNSAVSTQLVSEDYIRRNLGGSLMQTLEKLGGVNTIAIGSGQSKPVIRGLSFNRVVVAENGIKHEGQQWGADHGLEIDQYAVGSIRLVKGPQSLEFGSDAMAGVIEIERPRAPIENSSGGALDLTYKTNNNLYGSSLNIFTRKKSTFLDARITSLDYADYKVPVDHVTIYSYKAPLHDNRLRNTAGNELNLHLNTGYIGDTFSSLFYFSNLKSESGLFANAHGLEPRNVDTGLHDASKRDIQHPSQKVNHFKVTNRTQFKWGSHSLKAELGYQNNFRQEFSDYISHGSMPANYPPGLPIEKFLEREFNKNTYSVSLADSFSLDSHVLILGATAEHQNNNIGGWGFVIPKYRQSSAGVYLLDKVQLNDRMVLHLGLRYDLGTIATGNYYDWFTSQLDQGPVNLQRATALKRDFGSPSWAIGVNYNMDHFFLRANLGKSFRMPIAKELASNGVNYHQFSYELGDAGLSAEKAYQLDLGLTYEKGGLMAELSPFLTYFPNYIYLNPTPEYDYAYGAGNQIYRYTQSRVLRYGSEARINYTFLESYTLGATAEFVNSEQLSGAKKGYSLPFSPAPSVLFNFTYTTSFRGAFETFSTGIDYRLVGPQNTIVPPENKTPGYNAINLLCSADVRFNGQLLQLSLQVQNLLDSKNLNHTSFYRIIGVPEPGRNIVVSAKIPFVL